MFRLRRIACAICVGIVAWSVVHAIESLQATCTVMVAAQAIGIGDIVTDDMLREDTMPQGDWSRHALQAGEPSPHGGIAQMDIAQGEPILDGMISQSVTVAADMTTVEVPVASSVRQLRMGATASLVTGGECAGTADGEQPSGSETSDPGSPESDDTQMRHRMLAESALVIDVPESDDGSTSALNRGTSRVVFAMTADEALGVLAVDTTCPIVAVAAEGGEQ